MVLQAIFAEQPTVQERLSDLMSLSCQLSVMLDVNDQTTLKETVSDAYSRLNVVSAAAGRRENSLSSSVAMWNEFQVCISLLLLYKQFVLK